MDLTYIILEQGTQGLDYLEVDVILGVGDDRLHPLKESMEDGIYLLYLSLLIIYEEGYESPDNLDEVLYQGDHRVVPFLGPIYQLLLLSK